ncbi:MAG: ATP-binding protein [Gammaproteobacteria bacterium]
MKSLSARLLVSVSLLLVLFFGIAALALDIAFRNAAEQAVRDVLEGHLFGLLAAADPDSDGRLTIPSELPEEHFANPGSGFYGRLENGAGDLVWRSNSSIGVDIPYPGDVASGESRFLWLTVADGSQVMALSMGITWEFEDDRAEQYTFNVARSLDPYYEQIGGFRKRLLGSFAGLAALLLLSLTLLLRWVLKPLRLAESEIKDIESGMRGELSAGYPSELQGLTANMNALIRLGRGRLERYRDTLGNLAHSLKTPLAVIRNALEREQAAKADVETMREQVDRMNEIVAYQLKRAAVSGGVEFGTGPVDAGHTSDRICNALSRVYRDKNPSWRRNGVASGSFYGDAGDLTEVLGNLLDNAFKWCNSEISVSLEQLPRKDLRHEGLRIVVEDDGPGIANEHNESVTRRGTRVDETPAGQGIGLAVVKEIVELYGGTLRIDSSPLGGARLDLRFPPA